MDLTIQGISPSKHVDEHLGGDGFLHGHGIDEVTKYDETDSERQVTVNKRDVTGRFSQYFKF